MKGVAIVLALVLAAWLLVFGAFAFAAWSIDPGSWDVPARGGLAWGCAIIGFVGLAAILATLAAPK